MARVYEWSNELVRNVFTLGNVPTWYTWEAPAALAATTQSPLGEGSTLERCQLFAAASATVVEAPITEDPFQLHAVSILLMAEVFPVGAPGLPDPNTSGALPAALTAVASVQAIADPDPSASLTAVAYSTGSIVTTHSERTPAHYGAGVPELRLSVFGACLFDVNILGATDSSEMYWLRALWSLPG
jgi:hypothetical protein